VTSRIVGDTLQDAEATTLGGAPGSTTARQLTARERRLLLDLADGMTQKQIAIAENLSARTVRRQIDRMRMKLDASTLFTLGVNAARLRIVP
jgi:DNA-binding CsgD family transcriptional regulator